MIELFNMDCMEYMKGCKDNEFDLAIVDPPYGIGADKGQESAAKYKCKGWKEYKKTDWDTGVPKKEYWNELFRVSKNQIVWGGNYMTDYLPPKMGWILWNKMQREFTLADGELAWTSFDKALRIFDMSRGAALANNKVRFHPTQKPIKLYEWTLEKYSKPGQRILDTHLGSGSSAIAAHYYGVDFVGCELDEDYFNAAQARFNNETKQAAMF